MRIDNLNLNVAGISPNINIQSAIDAASDYILKSAVWIPSTYAGTDTYTNPKNVPIFDMRGVGSTSFGSASTLTFAGPPTGTCTAAQTAVNVLTGDFYACIVSAWIKVGPGGNPGVLTSPVITPNPLAFDVDLHFKGPNPWADVTRYGVRATNPAVAPSAPGITATINSGSNSAALSSASTFQLGDGVVIYGAGAAQSMATPGAPTVTPSLPKAAMLTPLFVVNGPTGATTYNYKVVARDTGGGLTAASTVGTTTTGASALGARSAAITSLSQAANGNTVSVVTSAAHGLSVGAMFYINGTTNDGQFGGWYNVASTADNTHFTYVTGQWNFTSISITGTGGTVNWYNCNHISWSPVTGAWEYYIYSDRANPGTFALLGVSRPNSSFVPSDNTWDDYGSPMMDGIKLPPFVPTTAPSVATSDHLVTTITSGAGTTTLTLAANAGTSVSSVTILFDNAPNLKAVATANSFGAPLYFPAGGTYVINSFCDLTGSQNTLMQSGVLYLNETLMANGLRWYGDRTPQFLSAASFQWPPGGAAITVNTANPGVMIPSANSSGFYGLSFTQTANAGISMMIDSGNATIFENVSFATVQGSSDYAGIGVMFRSTALGDGNVFGFVMDQMTFVASQSQNSAVPLFFCQSCGSGRLTNLQLSGRSLAFSGQSISGAGPFAIENVHIQASTTPFVMNSPSSVNGQGSGSFLIKNVGLDTMGSPMFTQFGGAYQTIVKTTLSGTPAAQIPNFSGAPLGQLIADTSASTSGQNFRVSVVSGNGITVTDSSFAAIGNVVVAGQGVQVAGVLEMGYAFSTPAAPTVVLGGSGSCSSNCVPAGTYVYGVSANDVNQGYSTMSPVSAPVTTDGTQTITVSWILQNGQVSANRCRGISANSINCDHAPGSGSAGASFVDSSLISYTNSRPTITTGNSEGISSQGFAGHAVTLIDPTSEVASVFTGAKTFANLGTPANLTFTPCIDCTLANPCAGSGTGALAKRLNGVWVCN